VGWKQIPFLRCSSWRLVFGRKRLTTEWQGGDGRVSEYLPAI
jgi:hypothetical protein